MGLLSLDLSDLLDDLVFPERLVPFDRYDSWLVMLSFPMKLSSPKFIGFSVTLPPPMLKGSSSSSNPNPSALGRGVVLLLLLLLPLLVSEEDDAFPDASPNELFGENAPKSRPSPNAWLPFCELGLDFDPIFFSVID